jgi:ribosome-associated protein
MTGPIEIRPGFTVPLEELSWRFSRSSGPGGQSVNTTDSRVSLSFDVSRSPSVPEHLRARMLARLATRLSDGLITVHAETERSQLMNRSKAQSRLVELLRAASDPPPKKRRPTRPTKSSTAKRLEGKKLRGNVKRLRRNTTDD